MNLKSLIIAAAVAVVAIGGGVAAGSAYTQSHADADMAVANTAHRADVKKARDVSYDRGHDAGYSEGYDAGHDAALEEQQDSGYHDADKLANSIKAQKNKDFKQDDLSVRVDDVGCVAENTVNTRFTCLMEFSDGDRVNVIATVSADGSSWVTKAAS